MRALRDHFDYKRAELRVRQSVAIGDLFGAESPQGGDCQFCEQPPFKAGLCRACWEECVQAALENIRQQRELRKAQKGTVGFCPHCQSGKSRRSCGYCSASGRQALPGFVFCPGCSGSGLRYGHTHCTRCDGRGILTEQEFYAGLAPAQAEALRQALAADGIAEPRLCPRLSEVSWDIHVGLYFGNHNYKSYSVDLEGAVEVVGA